MFSLVRLTALALICFVLSGPTLADNAPADRLRTIAAAAYDGDRPGASVIVYRDGEILLHEAYGLASLELGVEMTTANRFRIASVTKQFTGATVMSLVEAGILDLDEDIRTYLPDFADKGETITLRHLLGHTSGLYNYTNHDDYEAIDHTDISLQATRTYFEDLPLDFPVGSQWSYSNSGYALTSLIIETVTGREFQDIVTERIFEPAGMTQSQFQLPGAVMANSPSQYWHGETGFYPAQRAAISGHGDGEIYSTTGDLLRWYQALSTDRLFSAETRRTFQDSPTLADGQDTRYGLGLFHGRIGPHASLEHGGNVGGWRAYVIMVPEEDVFVALLANSTDQNESIIATDLAKAALGLENSRPEAVTLDPRDLDSLTGTYRHGPGDERQIRVHETRLQSRRGGGDWYDLVPIGEDHFMFDDDPDTQIRFTENGLNVGYRYGMDHRAVRVDD